MTTTDFLIISVITAVLLPLITAGVNASRAKRAVLASDANALVLTYPKGFKSLCIGMLLLWLGLAVLFGFVLEPETELDRVLGILVVILPMTLVSMWLLLEATHRQLVITDRGLETRSPWRATFLPWSDVECFRYSFLNSWLVIKGRGGRRVRASRYLNGTADLVDALSRHVSPEVLAESRGDLELFRKLSTINRVNGRGDR